MCGMSGCSDVLAAGQTKEGSVAWEWQAMPENNTSQQGAQADICSPVISAERVVSSSTGIVNLYSHEEAARAGQSGETSYCKPLKTITNLTTAATTLSFNHDSQLLALASNAKKDSLKMVHLPSMTVFSNWPTVKSPLGVITNVAFSKMSEYMAVGNEKGKVVLYMLPHFARK